MPNGPVDTTDAPDKLRDVVEFAIRFLHAERCEQLRVLVGDFVDRHASAAKVGKPARGKVAA